MFGFKLFSDHSLGFVISLLLVLPVLDVLQDGLSMDVRHVVVLCELATEVRFTCARLSSQSNFEWFKTTMFTKLVFNELNVTCETKLAVPSKIRICCLLAIGGLITTSK